MARRKKAEDWRRAQEEESATQGLPPEVVEQQVENERVKARIQAKVLARIEQQVEETPTHAPSYRDRATGELVKGRPLGLPSSIVYALRHLQPLRKAGRPVGSGGPGPVGKEAGGSGGAGMSPEDAMEQLRAVVRGLTPEQRAALLEEPAEGAARPVPAEIEQ